MFKIASVLPKPTNTVVTNETIAKWALSWQAHLERIGDFLLCGGGGARPEVPQLHHFRASNFTCEHEHLKRCWKLCLQQKVPLPLEQMKIVDENDNHRTVNYNLYCEENEVSLNVSPAYPAKSGK